MKITKLKYNKIYRQMIYMIDPPEGWKYGFPKTTTRKPKSYKAWCIRKGYPKKLADSYGEDFYVGLTTFKYHPIVEPNQKLVDVLEKLKKRLNEKKNIVSWYVLKKRISMLNLHQQEKKHHFVYYPLTDGKKTKMNLYVGGMLPLTYHEKWQLTRQST